MADPILIYRVSWIFPSGLEFAYAVRMKESHARLIEAIFQRYINSGDLEDGVVEEVGDPISTREFMTILKSELPAASKEWMP